MNIIKLFSGVLMAAVMLLSVSQVKAFFKSTMETTSRMCSQFKLND